MSRAIKILWIVIGSIFALGIVLAVVGFSLGATGNAWFDRQGLHFGGGGQQNTLELADDNTASFNNLNIQLLDADVQIVVADNYGYDFNYTGANAPTAEVNSGTLTVVEQSNSWHVDFFNFWNANSRSTLKIYVPKDAVLDNVSISTASGNTTLSGDVVSIKNLNCKSLSGDINLTNFNLEQLSLDVASGNVTMKSVAADQATINLLSGWLNYNDAQLNSLVLSMASGNVNLDGEITGLLQMHTLSGDATITLSGSRDDYSFDFRKLSGDIRINGQLVDGNSSLPSTSSQSGNGQGGHISVDTASGSVNINFR